MKHHKKLLALFAGSALACSGAAFAQTSTTSSKVVSLAAKTEKKPVSNVTRGTIKSMDDRQLVIAHKVNGKEKDLTFQLNGDTQKQGDLKPGAAVTVHYRYENKQDVATMVRADQSKRRPT